MLSPKVKITTQGDVNILALQGEFVGGKETDDLRDALQQQTKDGTKKLLIDLAGATYLNSTALGVLIAGHTSFSKREARIGLCNVSKNIENIFVITKLTLVFSIYSTREEGVRKMSEEGEVTNPAFQG
jgi:anti-anti-sigma factor